MSMKKQQLEWVSYVFAVAVISGSAWYWNSQVRSVLEILEMAYG